MLSFFGGTLVGGLGGVQSHFHVQPKGQAVLRLCCVVVGVVTVITSLSLAIFFSGSIFYYAGF